MSQEIDKEIDAIISNLQTLKRKVSVKLGAMDQLIKIVQTLIPKPEPKPKPDDTAPNTANPPKKP